MMRRRHSSSWPLTTTRGGRPRVLLTWTLSTTIVEFREAPRAGTTTSFGIELLDVVVAEVVDGAIEVRHGVAYTALGFEKLGVGTAEDGVARVEGQRHADVRARGAEVAAARRQEEVGEVVVCRGVARIDVEGPRILGFGALEVVEGGVHEAAEGDAHVGLARQPASVREGGVEVVSDLPGVAAAPPPVLLEEDGEVVVGIGAARVGADRLAQLDDGRVVGLVIVVEEGGVVEPRVGVVRVEVDRRDVVLLGLRCGGGGGGGGVRGGVVGEEDGDVVVGDGVVRLELQGAAVGVDLLAARRPRATERVREARVREGVHRLGLRDGFEEAQRLIEGTRAVPGEAAHQRRTRRTTR
mmetsp:Transcript_3515/g.13650  ORF Transcript_3515/g.13650 Transcript_3515/m.13650 type:complete len:354 (+) Transcript_3515:1497-2558(+)